VVGLLPAPVNKRSTVLPVTGTFAREVPAGEVALSFSVDPQSSPAVLTDLNVVAATEPNDTPMGQPRLAPVMVVAVPPAAGPDVGEIADTDGLPGANSQNSSAGDVALQPDPVHACTSTKAGLWDTVWVMSRVSLATVNVYWVPNEVPEALVSTNCSGATSCPAKPWPVIRMGVPPVSGPP